MKKWKTKSGYEIIRILYGRSNAFLLTDGKRNILIDTSVSRLYTRLLKRIKKMGIVTIDYLILTHAHFDHVANANNIRKRYNSQLVIHENETECLKNGISPIPKGTTFFTKQIVRFVSKILPPTILKFPQCEPDIVVNSGYDLNEIGFNAYLMPTPGHTAGSMSVIVDNEIAIVGDAMFGVFKWSILPPYANDREMMIKSWGKLLETGCREFLPAHGTADSRLMVQKNYQKQIR